MRLRFTPYLPGLFVAAMTLAACSSAVDSTPPSVSITSPAANAVLDGTVTVRVSASDASEVTRVELEVDGQPAQTLTTPPYEWTWETATFDDGPHTLLARAYDDAGNVGSSGVVQVNLQNPFFFTVTNTTQTPLSLSMEGTAPVAIPAGQAYTTEYAGNPEFVSYYATTSGRASNGSQIGLELYWDNTVDVRDQSHNDGVSLVVTPTYAFFYLTNVGSQTLGPLVVNAGLTDQTTDNIAIPANGQRYTTGYYRAYTNTEVRAYWPSGVSYTYWAQGTHFSLPFTQNQTADLTNNLARTGEGTAPAGLLVEAAPASASSMAAGERAVIRGPHVPTRTDEATAR